MTEIYLIRHGETENNRLYKFVGSTDQPLNDRGMAQARSLTEPMSHIALDRIWSSPYRRTMMTAECVRGGRDIPLLTDRGLCEIHCGQWEGLGKEEIDARWPGQIELWEHKPDLLHMEDGETFAEVQDRAVEAFCRIAREEDGHRIAVVSHMLTIQLIMAKLLCVPIRDVWQMVRLENTSITTMHVFPDGHFNVERWADDSHLPEELKNPNVKIAGIHNTSFTAKYTVADVEGEHYFEGFCAR